MRGFCLIIELHRERSLPTACKSGLLSKLQYWSHHSTQLVRSQATQSLVSKTIYSSLTYLWTFWFLFHTRMPLGLRQGLLKEQDTIYCCHSASFPSSTLLDDRITTEEQQQNTTDGIRGGKIYGGGRQQEEHTFKLVMMDYRHCIRTPRICLYIELNFWGAWK